MDTRRVLYDTVRTVLEQAGLYPDDAQWIGGLVVRAVE